MQLYGEESVSHTNLFSFLGHLQRTTVDSQADVSRLSRGMTIRRAKKRKYILNDTRIKTCLRRFDDNVYTRLEFLKAVSHSMGAHSCDLYTEATDLDNYSTDDDQASADAGAATVNATDANEMDNSEVCLVAQRVPRLALVLCGHQRFCEARKLIRQLERIGNGCPICSADISMVIRLSIHFAFHRR